MNKLEYLNTIAKDNRQSAPKKSNVSGGLIAKIAIGGLILFAILMCIGALLGNGSNKSVSLTQQIYYRTTSLNQTISTYNKLLKSSKLRAIGLSLSAALTGATSQLSTYMNEAEIDTNPPQKILTSETANINSLAQTLQNAKLNGILDRIYANQIHFQVSLLLSLLSENIERTDNANLSSILSSYQANLSTIEQSFQNYSDASD